MKVSRIVKISVVSLFVAMTAAFLGSAGARAAQVQQSKWTLESVLKQLDKEAQDFRS